jgi:hypothetical protein
MPLVVFWLTPVVLVMVFLLFLISQRPHKRRRIFLIEPLLFLFEKFRVARSIGNEQQLKKLLSYWLPGLEMQQSVVEQLVRQIEDAPPLIAAKDTTVLTQQPLPFWAELRHLEVVGKSHFVLAGPISELINYCDADFDGPITQEKRVSWPGNAETADKNGFWTLALAESHSPDAMLRKKFKLAGLVVLEPVLNAQAVAEVRQAASQGEVRLLSVMSANFCQSLLEKIFPELKVKAVSGPELSEMSPRDQERLTEAAKIYGEVGQKNRYWIARQLQRHANTVVISKLPIDTDLPADQRL